MISTRLYFSRPFSIPLEQLSQPYQHSGASSHYEAGRIDTKFFYLFNAMRQCICFPRKKVREMPYP